MFLRVPLINDPWNGYATVRFGDILFRSQLLISFFLTIDFNARVLESTLAKLYEGRIRSLLVFEGRLS